MAREPVLFDDLLHPSGHLVGDAPLELRLELGLDLGAQFGADPDGDLLELRLHAVLQVLLQLCDGACIQAIEHPRG